MVKRTFDIIISAFVLIAASPVLIATAVIIRIKLGKPVLFRQTRPGLHGRPFQIIKFRTMNNAVDEKGELRPDAERLTGIGRFLRSTSLDELPELFNILKGDMSLVGPRPLLMQYLDLYTPEQARRHEVRPGMTGWAQVNGRNDMTWKQKFKCDVWYIDNQCLWLDIKIIGMTAWQVLCRRGISADNHATMPEFRGDK